MRKTLFRGLPEDDQTTLEELDFNNIKHKRGFLIGSLVTDFKDEAAITGNLFECDEDGITPDWWWSVRPETVGEWTGLRDSQGNLIWEDDILQFNLPDGQERFGVVVSQDGEWIILSKSNCLTNFDILQKLKVAGDRFHDKALARKATETYAERLERNWWKGGCEND